MNTLAESFFDREKADTLARELRYIITDMICRSGSGHLGGALSLVEIIITLYTRIMKTDHENPDWQGRDRFVLSKGHAGPVLYAMLAHLGFFPRSWLGTLNMNGTRLPSHVDQVRTPGIDMTAGSLGQGLSGAAGLALAAKLDGREHHTFCIIGDGESNEGQIWEAALFAAHQKLDRLVAITDYNRLQIDGRTSDVLNLDPLPEKWKSFGWEVFETDGHDWEDIYATINAAKSVTGRPSMIIAHTIKGKGHPLLENRAESHNIKVPDKESHDRYLSALGYRGELPY